MINLYKLQWMTRCISHANEDKNRAIKMAQRAMDMFCTYPALQDRYAYLYAIASKQIR